MTKTTGAVKTLDGHIFLVTVEFDRHEIHSSKWKLLQAADGPVEGTGATEKEAVDSIGHNFRTEAEDNLAAGDDYFGFENACEGSDWTFGRRVAA